jgi:hypothetical protein
VDTGNFLAKAINDCDPTRSEFEFRRYNRLLMMAMRESKAVTSLSAKLRLAPQHVRRVEHVVPTRPQRPPWEIHT